MKSVVVITGGADGLGRALADRLSADYHVVILDIDEVKLISAAKNFHCTYQVCDITQYSQVDAAVKKIITKYGQINCLINCAGVYTTGRIDLSHPAQIQKVINVNILGTIFMTRAVAPYLISQKSGTIININSKAGLTPKAGMSVYRASKWAITGFTRSIQPELAKHNIKVVSIFPGVMKTKFVAKAGATRSMKRAIAVDEVVNTIEFVLSQKSATIISEICIKNLLN